MSNTYIATAISVADRFLPRLMISDYLKDAALTASSGVPEAVQNLTTYSRWQASTSPANLIADFGASKSIDYVAAYVTDPDASDFSLEYWSGAAWVSVGPALSRIGAGCLLWLFEPVSTSKVRLTTSAQPEVAVLKCGLSTLVPVGIPVGYEPSLFNPNEKTSTTASVTGQILGTQVESQRINESLSFDHLEPDWIEDTWMPIRSMLRSVGVFFAWNLQDHSSHVVYAVAVGDPSAAYSQVSTMRVTLKMEGPKHVL